MLGLTKGTGVLPFFKNETKNVLEVYSYFSTWQVHRALWPRHRCTWVPAAAVYCSERMETTRKWLQREQHSRVWKEEWSRLVACRVPLDRGASFHGDFLLPR